MAKGKSITVQTAPDLGGTAQVNLNKKDFNASIWNQGYNVWIERAVKCPCKDKNINNNLSTCKNCGSTGWLFINKIQTKAILHSMDWQNSYKEWSEENLGNVNITVQDENKLSFMDKLTVIDAETVHKMTAYPYIYGGELVVSTVYPIKEVLDIFGFTSAAKPLTLLVEGVDYFLGSTDEVKDDCNDTYDNFIRFSSKWKKYFSKLKLGKKEWHISISYKHSPQYHIVHLGREAMVAVQKDGKNAQMPISAVGRRAHYILDAENFNGDRILDNSYSTACKV